ncbi:MAG: transcriptional regulator, TetR family [Acidimicrobiia bacterium]|nr:transcriptional regulator, TetR family [Acidimicrobiia bacterium]
MKADQAPRSRNEHRAATMSAIEVAALREFLERGFEETTADQIAAASGVSVRTFFRYFPRGKEDVMVVGTRRWMGQLQLAMQRRPPHENAWVAIREAARSVPTTPEESQVTSEVARLHYQVTQRHPDLQARQYAERQTLSEPLVDMAALRMSVDPNVDMRPRLLVSAMLAACGVAWVCWLSDPDGDVTAHFETALDLVEAGMARTLDLAPAPPK